MKNKNQRVIALDYFRGICMLMVVINHFSLYINPLTYLTGSGRLWTSAAEMFFLISGITFAVVRSKYVKKDFKKLISKSFSRALSLYLINAVVVLASLSIAFTLISHGRGYNIPGALPDGSFWHAMAGTLMLRYGFGWASFLMYYSLFLLFAPFALKALFSKFWVVVPIISVALFGLSVVHPVASSPYLFFFVWQLYFFFGLILGRFRLNILGWYSTLSTNIRKAIAYSTVGLASIILLVSALSSFRTPHYLKSVPGLGFLHMHQPQINYLLQHSRAGLLRPLVTLIVFGAAYIVYQMNKSFLLKYTGKFVNTIGSNSLVVFVAQALAIPLISPFLPHNIVTLNLLFTVGLIGMIWLVVQRQHLVSSVNSAIKNVAVTSARTSYQLIDTARLLREKIAFEPEID